MIQEAELGSLCLEMHNISFPPLDNLNELAKFA